MLIFYMIILKKNKPSTGCLEATPKTIGGFEFVPWYQAHTQVGYMGPWSSDR
jgi:hypothetical protein